MFSKNLNKNVYINNFDQLKGCVSIFGANFFITKNFSDKLDSSDTEDIVLCVNSGISSENNTSKWYSVLTYFDLLPAKVLSRVVESKDLNPLFQIKILSEGYYSDINIIDRIALDKDYSEKSRAFCAERCSLDTLLLLAKDSSFYVRRSALNRIGPVDGIDFALSDKRAEIRSELGSKWAPIFSDKADSLVSDKSVKVLAKSIRKMSRSKVLFLLGNKRLNSKPKFISLLKKRLNGHD